MGVMAVGSWDVVKQKMILIDKRGVVNPLRDCAEELSTLTPTNHHHHHQSLGTEVSCSRANDFHIMITTFHRGGYIF